MWTSLKGPTRLWDILLFVQIVIELSISTVNGGNELWPIDRPDGMPTINSLEVMCGKDHMDVHLSFSHPFEGIVSSKGQHSDPRCVYVPPSTGKTFFSFRIAYARCGTKPDLNGQFYENTVVVQYDKDLLEVWDEAKRLRCEWFNDYEKTASKPPMVIADLDVIQLDFRGDNVDCWMEIQHGKGPWAPPVSGIVPLGSTLTLVVAINDYRGEFDMRVKSCVASDGGGHIIKLSDEYGCVLRPKMISRFLKARAPDERATVITYAFFHAFKFPDALSVHIKCKVEICRHGCLDHCQLNGGGGGAGDGIAGHAGNIYERKDTVVEDDVEHTGENSHEHGHDDTDAHTQRTDAIRKSGGGNNLQGKHPSRSSGNLLAASVGDNERDNSDADDDRDEDDDSDNDNGGDSAGLSKEQDVFYDDIIHRGDDMAAIGGFTTHTKRQPESLLLNEHKMSHGAYHEMLKKAPGPPSSSASTSSSLSSAAPAEPSPVSNFGQPDDKFPHGPRYFEAQNRVGAPAVAGPRALMFDKVAPVYRSRRSVTVSDRKARSADVGVSGIYDVISEADLAFSPDTKQEAVTVFQGKITEEVVYGICMPVPGFSVLFILVTSAAIVAALVAGSLLYRYQLQKETYAHQKHQQIHTAVVAGPHHTHHSHNQQQQQQQQHHHHNHHQHHLQHAAQNTIASWMTMRLFRMRGVGCTQAAADEVAANAAAANRIVAASTLSASTSATSMSSSSAASVTGSDQTIAAH